MLRAIAGGCLIFAIAGAIVLIVSMRAPKLVQLAPTPAEPCASSAVTGVAGSLPSDHGGTARAIVQILPAKPYGDFYLDELRERMGLPKRAAVQLTTDEAERFSSVMRYANIYRSGKFVCGRLEAGDYLAIATSTAADGYSSVDVAHFAVPEGRAVTLLNRSFTPIQELH